MTSLQLLDARLITSATSSVLTEAFSSTPSSLAQLSLTNLFDVPTVLPAGLTSLQLPVGDRMPSDPDWAMLRASLQGLAQLQDLELTITGDDVLSLTVPPAAMRLFQLLLGIKSKQGLPRLAKLTICQHLEAADWQRACSQMPFVTNDPLGYLELVAQVLTMRMTQVVVV